MNYAENVHVVTEQPQILSELERLNHQLTIDHLWLMKEKGKLIKVLDDLKKIMQTISKINIPQEGSVPLYFFPCLPTGPANGKSYQIAAEVNTLSLDALRENSNIDTTDLIKTLSRMNPETFIESVMTVITFGIHKIIRITIPTSPILLEKLLTKN